MARSLYEEKILEEIRFHHKMINVLYDILSDVRALRKEKKDGETNSNNG